MDIETSSKRKMNTAPTAPALAIPTSKAWERKR
jgi:hypothetical protein